MSMNATNYEVVDCESLAARLDSARANSVGLVVISGESGVGKTQAVEAWVSQQEFLAWPKPSATIIHDFKFKTGFLRSAKRGLGWKKHFSNSPWERGRQIARSLSDRNGLAVLDSIQTIQLELGTTDAQRIIDPAVDHFVQQFSRLGKGMCILISDRPYPIPPDVNGLHLTMKLPEVEFLAQKMSSAGVEGRTSELEYIAECLGRNPAIVNTFARLVVTQFDGDAQDGPKFEEPSDDSVIKKNVALLLDACLDVLATTGEDSLLNALSVIPGLMSLERLSHFRTTSPIANLTDYITHIADEDWTDVGGRAISLGLVRRHENRRDGQFLEIESVARRHYRQRACSNWHDEVRELCDEMSLALRSHSPSHSDHRRDLYDAINFGCLAGRNQSAFDIYSQRLANEHYTYFKKEFIPDEWTAMRLLLAETSTSDVNRLDDHSRGIAEHTLGHCYRMVGKCENASDLIAVALNRFCEGEHWEDAQRAANHLAVCCFMQARLADALTAAIASVAFEELKSSHKQLSRNHTTVGKILKLAGRIEESEKAFVLAKGKKTRLTGFAASRFVDLLIATNRLPEAHQLLEEIRESKKESQSNWNGLADHALEIKQTYINFIATPKSRRLKLPREIDAQIGAMREVGLQEEVHAGLVKKAKMLRLLQSPDIDRAEQCLDESLLAIDPAQAKQLRIDVLLERCHLERLRSNASKLSCRLDELEGMIAGTEQTFRPEDTPLAPWVVGPLAGLIPSGTTLRYDCHNQEISRLREAVETDL